MEEQYHLYTPAILASLFDESEYPASYTLDEIRGYFEYLSRKTAEHLETDMSEETICECCMTYPEMYALSRTSGGSIAVKSRGRRPNTQYFLDLYARKSVEGTVSATGWEFEKFITSATKSYLEEKTAREHQ